MDRLLMEPPQGTETTHLLPSQRSYPHLYGQDHGLGVKV